MQEGEEEMYTSQEVDFDTGPGLLFRIGLAMLVSASAVIFIAALLVY